MTITVNGEEIEFVEGESVNRLLKRMRYNFPLIIVKVDGDIVEKKDFIKKKIHDGAEVEVIHLTSGG